MPKQPLKSLITQHALKLAFNTAGALCIFVVFYFALYLETVVLS
tara:strand:- start:472 stop:603 length:132 start_codon:yes stop_codon:yes gene_type:complete